MYIHIQVANRETMGKLYQSIVDSSYWETADAIFHDYNKRRITIDVAQPDVTDRQEDWLANHRLIEKWWKSWDRDDAEMNPSEIAMIAIEALQAEGITTWGEGGRLGDALLAIKDMADDALVSKRK